MKEDDLIHRKLDMILDRLDNSRLDLGDFISETDAKKLLQRGTTWFWTKRKNGELPYTKVGSQVYYAKDDILAWMNSNKKSGQQ